MSMAHEVNDRDLLRQASSEVAILARCLDVDTHLRKWEAEADPVSGGIAADALDQARGLLEWFAGERGRAVADAVERIASTLPPPME